MEPPKKSARLSPEAFEAMADTEPFESIEKDLERALCHAGILSSTEPGTRSSSSALVPAPLDEFEEYEDSQLPETPAAAAAEVEEVPSDDDDNDGTIPIDDLEVAADTMETMASFSLILASSNNKIPDSPYSASLKSELETMCLQVKLLESFYGEMVENGKTNTSEPPAKLSDIVEKWTSIKPIVASFMKD